VDRTHTLPTTMNVIFGLIFSDAQASAGQSE
jgi:hypothetical protein